MNTKYYFQVIHGDVESELFGPYSTYKRMAQRAKKTVRSDQYREDGIHWFTLTGDKLRTHDFSGGEVEAWINGGQ